MVHMTATIVEDSSITIPNATALRNTRITLTIRSNIQSTHRDQRRPTRNTVTWSIYLNGMFGGRIEHRVLLGE